jgi:hypothetical protein
LKESYSCLLEAVELAKASGNIWRATWITGRPEEGMIAEEAEIWVVVGENGDRVLIAGVNPAPGELDGFVVRNVVRNVELCGPNFVDNP